MGAAHCEKTIAVGKNVRELRIHGAFVGKFMLDDVLCDNVIGFGDIFDSGFCVRIIEGVRDLA